MYNDDKLKKTTQMRCLNSTTTLRPITSITNTKPWSWIKKEVGDYDPSLMEKLTTTPSRSSYSHSITPRGNGLQSTNPVWLYASPPSTYSVPSDTQPIPPLYTHVLLGALCLGSSFVLNRFRFVLLMSTGCSCLTLFFGFAAVPPSLCFRSLRLRSLRLRSRPT